MGIPIHPLIVEDSELDAELVLRELRRGGYAPQHRRVVSETEFLAALEDRAWDVILCDYTLPGFSGPRALQLLRDLGIGTPVIIVSGTIGEETAVAAMKAGAQDYVIKDNLARLVPAIERELKDAEARRSQSRAEAERQAAETRFREVLAMAPDAILATDDARRITLFNRAAEALFGFTATEVIGKPVESLFSADAAEILLNQFTDAPRPALQGGSADGFTQIEGRRSSGEHFDGEATFSTLVENGETAHMAVIRDVTQRRLLEDQLHQAQKMEAVGQLTGGLAHDFNNLLTIIIGNLDLLLEQLAGNPNAERIIQQALGAGVRGSELTMKLLAFSRRQPLETKAFDVNELVTGTAEMLHRTLGEPIRIDLNLDRDLVPGLADPTQLNSALVNLAINARDAMPEGGRLTIETSNAELDEDYAAENLDVVPGRYVMLALSDTGTGIPMDIRDKVFEPFFTTKHDGKGTGLGLSMVYGFAKQSGGHVKIYSEVGIGTTIRIYLPRADGGQEALTRRPDTAVSVPETGGRILVVEDNLEVRQVVVSQLHSLGYETIEAEDGPTAMSLLDTAPPIDLLFTDIVMPGGMSGLDVADAARAIRPGLKVLFTSGYTEAALQNGTGLGPGGWLLSKPYRKAQLASKLHEVLSSEGGEP